MNESFSYSAYADRGWVVRYAPRTTNLFINPREYPAGPTAGPIWDNYYHGTLEGYCKTTYGARLTGIPSDSDALAYHYGQLGITSHLSGGYPEGKHVVDPVVVPHSSSTREGGVLIMGVPTTLTFEHDCSPAPANMTRGPEGATATMQSGSAVRGRTAPLEK
jgi:hypothetical protein